MKNFISKFLHISRTPEELQKREEDKKAKALEKEERRKQRALEEQRRRMSQGEYMDSFGKPGDVVMRLNKEDLFEAIFRYADFRFPGYRAIGASVRHDRIDGKVETYVKLRPVSPASANDKTPEKEEGE